MQHVRVLGDRFYVRHGLQNMKAPRRRDAASDLGIAGPRLLNSRTRRVWASRIYTVYTRKQCRDPSYYRGMARRGETFGSVMGLLLCIPVTVGAFFLFSALTGGGERSSSTTENNINYGIPLLIVFVLWFFVCGIIIEATSGAFGKMLEKKRKR